MIVMLFSPSSRRSTDKSNANDKFKNAKMMDDE